MFERETHAIRHPNNAGAYLVAVLVTALTVAVRYFLFGVLADAEPYMPFVISVMVAAAYGGLRPGLVATGLGAAAGVYFFVTPYFSLWIDEASEALAFVQFIIAGTTISYVSEALHRIRRRLEANQKVLQQEITERIKAETAARESEARVKEADRRKDEFLAMLAHELRNPLAVTRNAVQLLLRRVPQGTEPQCSPETIERQVECMTRLIDDLMDVSRIGQGKLELRKERVNLAEVVESAIKSSRAFIEEHSHELSTKLPSEPIYVSADPVRLAQVIMNLLNNAAKYTEKAGRIRLSVQRLHGEVIVSVKDNGIGIPPDKLPRVFDIYYQMGHSVERSEGGLGIGLTLVRRLVEMHGGTVEVRSEGAGKGSEFVVRLPTVEEAAAPSDWQCATDSERHVTAVRRVLVVDDNVDLANSFAMLLRMHGSEVQTAHDGLEGVQAAETFKPDVVLLDIQLPKVNGFDACRRIREQPWGKRMTLIALTGRVDEEDSTRTMQAGFDYYLIKPVKASDLQRLLIKSKAANACETVC